MWRRASGGNHRLVEAYQEELVELEELRRRSPGLRSKATALRAQLGALEAQAVDRETDLQLAERLESFLARLHTAAQASSLAARQRAVCSSLGGAAVVTMDRKAQLG